MKRKMLVRLTIFVALIATIAVASLYRDQISGTALEGWVRGAGPAGPLFFMLLYVVATVLFLPGSVLTLAGGALFGPVWGTIYNLIGATAGAAAAFLIARYLASDWVSRRASGWIKQVIDGVEQEGWRFVAFVRLIPLFPFNLLNYVLGLTRISLAQYVIASFVFMFPGALAYTYIGYAGREAIAGGEGLIRKGLLALALLGMVAFLPSLVKRLRGARRAPVPEKLSAAELKQRLNRREDIAVLDVRSPKDYVGELGHIEGSFNIPLDQLHRRLSELESLRDRPLAVVCRTNRMSGQAVELLHGAGFPKAMLVEDGMLGWRQADPPQQDRKGAISSWREPHV